MYYIMGVEQKTRSIKMTTKIKVDEYNEQSIKHSTTQILYWMANAAKEMKEGDGAMAHHALTNALRYAFDLSRYQQTVKAMNGFGELDLDFAKIYADCMLEAKAQIEEENK